MHGNLLIFNESFAIGVKMCSSSDILLWKLCFQGDRFGGALDAAARVFSHGVDSGQAPMEFVNDMTCQILHDLYEPCVGYQGV